MFFPLRGEKKRELDLCTAPSSELGRKTLQQSKSLGKYSCRKKVYKPDIMYQPCKGSSQRKELNNHPVVFASCHGQKNMLGGLQSSCWATVSSGMPEGCGISVNLHIFLENTVLNKSHFKPKLAKLSYRATLPQFFSAKWHDKIPIRY